MLNINPTVKAWIVVILIGAIAALKELAKLNPTLSWIGTLLQVLGAIELYLTTPAAAQERMRALSVAASKAAAVLVLLFSAGALAIGQAGCTPAQAAAVVPAGACVSSVIADAIAGLTIAQIVAKEGPSCVADAEQVAVILLGSGNAQLVGTVALDEARMKRGLPALRK